MRFGVWWWGGVVDFKTFYIDRKSILEKVYKQPHPTPPNLTLIHSIPHLNYTPLILTTHQIYIFL